LNSTCDFEQMGVSGEFRYLGPAFLSVLRVRPVKAMTFPPSLQMGNRTRLRNLEYMADGFRLSAIGFMPPDGRSPTTDSPSSFHENSPLARSVSSSKSRFRQSRFRRGD